MVTESTEQFLSGGGEMGKLIRSMDWSKTALGPIEFWPQSLRTSVSLCLSSTFPILIAWGPETIQIYNDSYRPICGAMHPDSMGQNFRICWESALEVVGDKFTRGQQGEGTYITDQQMFLFRYGYLEEAFMTFSFAPIRDESGGIGGIFHPITETTDKMLSARRTQLLRDLGAAMGKAKTIEEIGIQTADKFAGFVGDLPFLLFYRYNPETNTAVLISSEGLEEAGQLVQVQIDLNAAQPGFWPLAECVKSAEAYIVDDLKGLFGDFSCLPYPEAPQNAVLQAIYLSGQQEPFGFLIAGVSSRRALDESYLGFYDLLGNTFNTAVSNIYAYEQEQKRAQALAEIDRSKTAFFSNVSHEFRTPLTLMLGPLEDVLRQNPEAAIKAPLEETHRNALRLLKLVNNLLDYSRVEAGRAKAAYQLVDFCELSADLASSFRSIIETAGMKLDVNYVPFDTPVYADQQMWEKIVLNLLSNAFKYTLEGTISVHMEQEGKWAVLRVEDTGVGIPEKELPHMFERFHRVENTAGRPNEGTGIGLSLVHELVLLHGGKISVESTEGKGSTFTVKIPTGKAHLSADHIFKELKNIGSEALKDAFLLEAASLLQDEHGHKPIEILEDAGGSGYAIDSSLVGDKRILIVDDNADMRAYLSRLLSPYFTIETAGNGLQALEMIKESNPDLVLSDIMMPVMNGKEMLGHIRSMHRTARLPVIFLSARAGEEARIDGLEAGADDYLVKPFSATELLTKIKTQIKISDTRNHAERQLRKFFSEAPVAIALYRGPDHIIEMANDQMLQYWGRTESEIIGNRLADAVPELEAQGFVAIMDKIFQTGERFVSGEIPVQLFRNGKTETSFMNLTVEALLDEHNRITGMTAVAADITEQVNARIELQKAKDTLELAMDASGMGIWQRNIKTGSLKLSEKARIIHGIPVEIDHTYLSSSEMIISEHRERVLNSIETAIKNNEGFSEDYQIAPMDGGKLKWLNTTGKIEVDENGDPVSVIGTILDITESKEDALRKDDFIGMVSHELKTPLTSLNGYAQLLERNAKKGEDQFAQRALEKVVGQIKKMSNMINGFLNVSRLESGKINLDKQPFEFNELVAEVMEEVSSISSGHEIQFVPGVEINLVADRDKIGSVISNLLSNSVKYAREKTPIVISCILDNHKVVLSVTDQGMGISPSDVERLFDRYYRVENAGTKNISGFGIGLYLSAEIIRRHNGKISVQSEVGKGSVFQIEIPLI
ncbi:ATP-binding protein [Pedobacter metabolipauper]|uniref:histidine kinase n=1 Tax=Pedobacter metabolipauper TaxID=425513 RepID=A0A4R6SXZ4_9SPHI|nr:ATP-binding protein [Pedobacter metabolipauper]TDQ11276.1 PAS domain S-box-containing protein [Pedobacter metabolipauper]